MGGGGRMELSAGSIMELFPSQSTRYDKCTNTQKGRGIRPSCDSRGLLVVYICESGQGVLSEKMFTREVPCQLRFEECGTTFLANPGIQMGCMLFLSPPV